MKTRRRKRENCSLPVVIRSGSTECRDGRVDFDFVLEAEEQEHGLGDGGDALLLHHQLHEFVVCKSYQ